MERINELRCRMVSLVMRRLYRGALFFVKQDDMETGSLLPYT